MLIATFWASVKGHGGAEKAVGEAASTICASLLKGVHAQLRRGGRRQTGLHVSDSFLQVHTLMNLTSSF